MSACPHVDKPTCACRARVRAIGRLLDGLITLHRAAGNGEP
ncbi:hypothetical protein SAMN04488085_103453 [Geodermatophilus ruber]|uniref:Uncharacterized protein n=1 Tax=Geodermatophilus ruber TaxID=504800 RepID=A0A1I4CDB3_9ACTN|nr:hypothetical protein SAMN04488085_103453 [Geodermatophilus ruber]